MGIQGGRWYLLRLNANSSDFDSPVTAVALTKANDYFSLVYFEAFYGYFYNF